jgi:hypothetical protein
MRALSVSFAIAMGCGAPRTAPPAPTQQAVAATPTEDTTLRVASIEPDKGDVEGGTYVRLIGNRFIADGVRNAKVYFGSRQGVVVRVASELDLLHLGSVYRVTPHQAGRSTSV